VSWRNGLKVHPAADHFPMLPEHDLVTLGNDIKCNGLSSPIAIRIDKEGKPVLLDGRNRLSAMEIVGLRIRLEEGKGAGWKLVAEEVSLDGTWSSLPLAREMGSTVVIIAADPVAYITSINIHRRHLSVEQRQNLLMEIIARAPEKSDRQIAKGIGVDHKTVARARAKGEDVGRVPHVSTRTDSKGRRQPTSKPKKAATSEPKKATSTTPTPASPHPKSDAAREYLFQTARAVTGWATEENIGLAFDGLAKAERSAPLEADIKSLRECAAIFAKIVNRLDDETGLNEERHALCDEVEAKAQAGDGLDIPTFLRRAAH
jgi:hypothetical protein